VFFVAAAIATVFFDRQPFRVIALILDSCVIAPFATITSKRNDYAVFFLRHNELLARI